VRDTVLNRETASSGGNGDRVSCLDISPLGGVLATGCDDGIVRIWRFGKITTTDETAGASSTSTSAAGGASSSSTARRGGGLDEDVLRLLRNQHHVSPGELERLEKISRHLMPRLEGHVNGVTDVSFSNVGDRLVSGSMLDGTVRIWSFSRDFMRHEQIILSMADDDAETSTSAAGRRPAPAGLRGGRKKTKSLVNSVCWTMDDTRIVTLQSVPSALSTAMSTRLKVWDSMTGDLLRLIPTVSNISAKVLYPHPLDPTIVLTAGEDGVLNVWDIEKEERIARQEIPLLDPPVAAASTHVSIHDAAFSPDGSRIAVIDSVGRLSLVGIDNPDRYRHVLREQYFSSDYHEIMM
jgi:WD40 repeat protein